MTCHFVETLWHCDTLTRQLQCHFTCHSIETLWHCDTLICHFYMSFYWDTLTLWYSNMPLLHVTLSLWDTMTLWHSNTSALMPLLHVTLFRHFDIVTPWHASFNSAFLPQYTYHPDMTYNYILAWNCDMTLWHDTLTWHFGIIA